MGNSFGSTDKVNNVHNVVEELVQIGNEIKAAGIRDIHRIGEDTKYEIRENYRYFYNPDSLRKLEEMQNDFHYLRHILKNNIILFNRYNSTNIDVNEYIETTLEKLKITLPLIGIEVCNHPEEVLVVEPWSLGIALTLAAILTSNSSTILLQHHYTVDI